MPESGTAEGEPWRGMAVRSAVCTVATATAWWLPAESPASRLLFAVAYLSGALDLAKEVFADLRKGHFNTEFLMLLVALGAGTVGAWAEGALLLILFSASAAMEEYASGRTQREIGALFKGAPKFATQLNKGREVELPVADLKPGMQVRVRAGEQVPVDFEVLVGESACNESMLTGEVEPVSKRRGDTALAGTVNEWGVLDGTVLRAAGDSALQRIIRLIHEAQQQRAPTQRFTDRFGTRYTAAVITGCVALFVYCGWVENRPLFHSAPGLSSAFYRAMTLLVVLSPCALVLSVPSAILSAIACGARQGVLFRGGTAVELLAGVNTVALDKTGTLTEGELQLAHVESHIGTRETLLTVALGLARLSHHPVSRSLVRALSREGIEPSPMTDSETVAGQGIKARLGSESFGLGNRKLLTGWLTAEQLANLPAAPAQANETWVMGPGLLGRFELQDRLRPSARNLIEQLHAEGLQTLMLTGDREEAALRMARESGVGSVRAQLSPEGKLAVVEALRADGRRVAMVGDGVNDAPVLAAADVGVAMGARGSDAALEQADVVLMNDRLEQFLLARRLSRKAVVIIRQNLWVSLGAMAVMAGLTLVWPRLPLWMGVATHEGSTVLVVMNSLRLLFTPGGTSK